MSQSNLVTHSCDQTICSWSCDQTIPFLSEWFFIPLDPTRSHLSSFLSLISKEMRNSWSPVEVIYTKLAGTNQVPQSKKILLINRKLASQASPPRLVSLQSQGAKGFIPRTVKQLTSHKQLWMGWSQCLCAFGIRSVSSCMRFNLLFYFFLIWRSSLYSLSFIFIQFWCDCCNYVSAITKHILITPFIARITITT